MLFNSYVFIFAFLPVVFAIYAVLSRRAGAAWIVGWLTLASLIYYAWWNPAFVFLILASIAVNAGFGKALCAPRPASHRKALLVAGVAFNLGVLAYFKYAGFLVQNVNAWLDLGLAVPAIVLPIGISFITFQKIAFLVDAYHGEVRDFTLLNFALFVTFFPQLIAGPIVHHREVMPQFARPWAGESRQEDFAVGWSIFCIGLFKKVVIADSCGVYADAGYAMLKAGQPLDAASAWIAVLAYSFQLYYDFSGYSDMAVGLARLFGIRFPVNFHSPYKATGIIDFWRRWHITLSRFLRDYLYVPLGGNRKGALRQYFNLALVMLLGGLWHGANWTFVVWGGVHGVLLGVNHAWQRLTARRGGDEAAAPAVPGRIAGRFIAPYHALSVGVTFFVVTLAWVPFRSDTLHDAGRMFASLFPGVSALAGSFRNMLAAQFHPTLLGDLMTWFRPRELWPPALPPDFLATYRPAGLLLAGIALATFFLPNTQQLFARFEPVLGMNPAALAHRLSLRALDWKVALAVSGAFVLSVLHLVKVSPFLYYQF